MKKRTNFISNSSSSSFVIKREDLSDLQIFLIQNHIKVAIGICSAFPENKNEFDYLNGIRGCDEYDSWNITVDENDVSGNTIMDNFSMGSFLSMIGVKNVIWDDY